MDIFICTLFFALAQLISKTDSQQKQINTETRILIQLIIIDHVFFYVVVVVII